MGSDALRLEGKWLQHQTCKTKTTACKKEQDRFFWSETGLDLRPTVSDHITAYYTQSINQRRPLTFCPLNGVTGHPCHGLPSFQLLASYVLPLST